MRGVAQGEGVGTGERKGGVVEGQGTEDPVFPPTPALNGAAISHLSYYLFI